MMSSGTSFNFLIAIILLLLKSNNDVIAANLKDNLWYFEILHSSDISHSIVKRGINPSPHPFNKIKEVSFRTLGRDFRLILSPKKGILHSQFKAYKVGADGHEKPVFIDHESFYDGRVFGEVQSDVSIHLEDGMMTATIRTNEDTYHIEPSWRHLTPSENQSMIAYRGSDVKFSWDQNHDGVTPPRVCGYIKQEGNATNIEEENEDEDVERVKRQSDMYGYTLARTRCPLLLVADYRFYREMGGKNTKTTINYLISLIDRVHQIYDETVWRDQPEQDGFSSMGFVIKKIVVHSDATPVRDGEQHYNMFADKWDVRNLLEIFSREYSHKDFCLAHLFTDIKFEGGILGLAYVGSPRRNSVGGICTPEYFKNGYTLYLNSGLSSSRNHYGQRVITREADLVTAHEFGHNWGSEHDPDIPECSPKARQGGSYLMYTYSVSGYDINNKKFSPCSLRSIKAVLLAKSSRCFSEPEESFCGNLRVEGDEQCDAGLLGTEDSDACCDKNCHLRAGAVCSDKNSPCCLSCQYMQVDVKCRDAHPSTCGQAARCTGQSADCPVSQPMPDATECLEKGKCHHGKCIPFCETQGLQSCMCDVLADACKRCCRMNLNNTCFPVDGQDLLPDGTPCIHGFCNKGVCEKTIQDIVERFWDIIEDININTVLKFLRDNIVGTVLIVSILIWIPISCLISYFDRKRQEKEEGDWEWRRRDDLIHPSDNRRIIYTRNRSRASSPLESREGHHSRTTPMHHAAAL